MIEDYLNKVYKPAPDSHKGDNGKVLIIAGSKLFHSASIWPAEIASKIVDMVFYSSVDENNEIVKSKFENGIVVPRNKIDEYIKDAESVLIGPGLPRPNGMEEGDPDTKELTESLFKKYPEKKWVVDGGSLQVIDPKVLPKGAIVTPHHQEFKTLFGVEGNLETVGAKAREFEIVVLLKGPKDIISDGQNTEVIEGGNAGMTKGGTGDVLAGLVTALYSKNDAMISAVVGSYLNKKAGESLEEIQGLYFNATDLVDEIPVVMKNLL